MSLAVSCGKVRYVVGEPLLCVARADMCSI